MSEAKHTPGPWHTEPEEWTEGRGIAICSASGIVAIIDPEVEAGEVDRANARLIAAAPDLLAAAEGVLDAAMLSDWHLGNDGDWLPDCKSLRDAINQAREIA